jgi:uncharacterized membrane protein YqjE
VIRESEPKVPKAGGMRSAFAELVESFIGLASTRAQLAGIELVEERDRLILRSGLMLAGLLLIAVAALFAGAFVVVLFWDTHRLVAIATVTLVLAVAGALMLLRAKAIGRDAPQPFAATLAELEKDRGRLSRVVRGGDAEG